MASCARWYIIGFWILIHLFASLFVPAVIGFTTSRSRFIQKSPVLLVRSALDDDDDDNKNHDSSGMAAAMTTMSSAIVTRSLTQEFAASLSFSDDPILSQHRRKAFEKLQTIVGNLAEYEGAAAIELVMDKDIVKEDERINIIHINSLVFQIDRGVIILVILNSNDMVDIDKLKDLLETKKCVLASNVEHSCGFPPGSVPPIGHSPTALRTIVDEKLMLTVNNIVLVGGGGHPNVACRVRLDLLLMMEGTELADISVDADNSDEEEKTPAKESPESLRPFQKPFFPFPPPLESAAQACYDGDPEASRLHPTPVTIVGRLSGVRRMAQRLCFLDLAPPDYVGSGNSNKDQYDMPWKSVIDGADMAVQLLAGKTLCQALGDVEGPLALKRFKPGQLVLIQGKTNVGSRNSLENWLTKRSFDIVVFQYTILEEGSLKQEKPLLMPTIRVERHQNIFSNADVKTSQGSADKTIVDSLASSYLKLADIFPNEDPIVMVDDMESVNEFASCLQSVLESLPIQPFNGDDESLVPGLKNIAMFGIDCEWKPSFLMATGEPKPVLLLQISFQPLQKVFLFDMQTLARPLLASSQDMNPLETATSNALTTLFTSYRLLKIGFQLKADLRLLAGSYPHLPAFRLVHSVVEVSGIARKAMQLAKLRNSRQVVVSLAKLTEFMTRKPLSKEQQVSDWSIRPLTAQQLEYSSLDAAISPLLFEKAMKMADASWFPAEMQIGRWANDSAFSKSITSLRFMFLETPDPMAIRKLKAKQVVGEPYVVTQSWITGTDPPEVPSVPSDGGYGPYRDVNGILRVPVGLISIGDNPERMDSIVGQRVGKSKEKCLEILVEGNVNVPDGAMLEFQQRAGYVELLDGVVMFVNMPNKPGQGRQRGYPNEWINNGKSMTWFMRDYEWNGGNSRLGKKLLGKGTYGVAQKNPLVLLFVRMGKGDFLCCGPCIVSISKKTTSSEEADVKDWGLVELELEFLAFDKLMELTDFSSMIYAQEVDSNSDVGEEGSIDDISNEASKLEAAVNMLQLVERGDLITAMYLATKDCWDKSRSISFGLGAVKRVLAESTLDVDKAIKILDDAAELQGIGGSINVN